MSRFSVGDVAGLEIWDTARGPTGQYWDVPRAARSMEAGNRFVLQPGGGNAPARVRLALRASPGPIAPVSPVNPKLLPCLQRVRGYKSRVLWL